MMKYYVFTGRPVNAAYSLYDFMSNKRSTFIWGFPERYRSHPDSSKRNKNVKFYDEMQKEVENEKKRGEGGYAFLYIAGEAINRILLGGKIEGFFEDNSKYWPLPCDEKKKKKDSCPLRVHIKVEYLCVNYNEQRVKECFESKDDNSKECEEWKRDFLLKIPGIGIRAPSIVPLEDDEGVELLNLLKRECIRLGINYVNLVDKFKELINDKNPYSRLKALMLIHLVAGKNVIVVGPPGSGKTRIVKELCRDLVGNETECDLYPGNPEWTSFDTIGGKDINGIFRPGFTTNVIAESWRKIGEGKPAFLIIDELNRANVDLAFAQFFTLLDVEHRRDTPLLGDGELLKQFPERLRDVLIEDGLFVPFSFRVLATMNSYDRALLFKLGYALLRRFAIVEMRRGVKFEEGSNNINKIKEFINEKEKKKEEKIDPNCDLKESVDKQIIENSLKLSREGQGDFAVIDWRIHSVLNEKSLDDVLKVGGLDMYDLLLSIVCIINNSLHGFGAEVTEGPASDAIKFLVAALLLDEDWARKHVVSLIEEAIASYVMPQLGVLVNRVRAERMGIEVIEGEDKKISKVLNTLSKEFEDMGLKRTSELFGRLAEGEDVP